MRTTDDGRDTGHHGALLEAACAYWHDRGLPTASGQVVTAPGPPLLLLALLAAATPEGGGILLTRPAAAWHALPARLLGRPPHRVPVPADCGGLPDPFVLLETVRWARSTGDDPRVLVLSVADDPTGTVAPPELLHEVCEAAAEEDLLVVSDESGRDASHDPHDTVLVSPAEICAAEDAGRADSVVVLTAAGGTPPADGTEEGAAGLARFPGTARGRTLAGQVRAVLHALGTSLPAGAARAAADALAAHTGTGERDAAGGRTDGVLARALHDAVVAHGGLCRPPQAGHHVYADLEPVRRSLATHGVEDGARLEAELVRLLGPGAAAGHRFGDDPGALRVRLSTRLLAGADRPQAPDPLRAPHVRHALEALRHHLGRLTATG